MFAALARAHPRSESPRLAAANALTSAGRLDEAVGELEAAARLAPRVASVLIGLARLYLDPAVGRPADALVATRAARRLEPWREESYYLQARAHERLGDHAAARQAYRTLVASFPAGAYGKRAEQGLAGLSRSTYEVTLRFGFRNEGESAAERIRLRVQSARDFPPYSEVRLLEQPEGGAGHMLSDGTRYLSFAPFTLGAGEFREVRIRYVVAVAAAAYEPVDDAPPEESPERYLAASPFIESDAAEIVSLARTLAPGGSARERARRFYDFVLKRLTYGVQPQTLGALGALASPALVDCTEYAALFIALNRAAGIPARPVFGYLFDAEKTRYEISHLWAEFWEEGRGWVTADPTNGTLAPDRYFGRVESDYIPLWVPGPTFGDLAGVSVSYQSEAADDALVTELTADIRRVPSARFDAAGAIPMAFASTGREDFEGLGDDLPVVPAIALLAAALGVCFWHRRRRAA